MAAMKRTPSKMAEDYHEILSEEIDLLRDKETTPIRMKSIIYGVSQFIKLIKVEIEYQKLMGLKEEMPFFKYEEPKKL